MLDLEFASRDLQASVMARVNLGCPDVCPGWTCVDRRGAHSWDVYEWLEGMKQIGGVTREFRTKNLLEHLPDPGRFLRLCHDVLRKGGRITIVTDNAGFIPFYIPLWIRHTGVGAHVVNRYAIDHCDSVHYMVFTKMHLENLLRASGFKEVTVRTILLGSRLEATATA